MKVRDWRLLAGASSLALLASGAAAYAQEGQNATVEEIVVTAQKREQALQDVPVAVTALTSETLVEAGVVDMKSVSTIVPTLKTQESFQPIAQAYRIRGIGSEPSIPTFEPEVGLFIDGVYMPRSGLGVGDLVDVARVEVLSGPQSTLYGKNVNAGVINVVTKAPADEFEASLAATVSQIQGGRNATAVRLAGSISGPITDNIRGRLTAVNYDQDHTYKNLVPGAGDANNMHRYAVRGELAFDFGADTTLRVAAARSEIYDTDAINPEIHVQPTRMNALPAPPDNTIWILQNHPVLGPAFGVSPCPNTDSKDRVICTTDPTHTTGYNNLVSATLTSSFGGVDFTSITAWSDYRSQTTTKDVAQTQFPMVTYFDTQAGEMFSQEFRLTSTDNEVVEWQVGATYLKSEFNRGDHGETPTFVLGAAAPMVPLPGAPAGFVLGQVGDKGFLNSSSQSEYAAVFGQATWHIGERFALTGGLRFQHESKDASVKNAWQITPLNPGGVSLVNALLTPTSVNGTVPIADMDNFVGNITGEYHPTEDMMFYATYSVGSKSGGANIGFGNAPLSSRPFKPETVDNYEVGAKIDLFDRRARLSTAAFHAVYDDYQNAGFIGAQFNVNNAEEVVVDGVEANGAFALGHGLNLTASAVWLDARYETYTGGACAPPFPTPAPTACDLSGKPLPVAPNWSTSVGVDYERDIGWGELYARADWAWSSEYFTNTNIDPRLTQDAYSLVNVRLGVRGEGGWDASVFANNLLDQAVVVQDAVTTLFGKDPSYQRFLAPPREVGVTLRKTF